MAEYKLIKDFPMCPLEVGSIVAMDKLGQYVSEGVIIFEKEIIENYPEFWQKVEEVDYEILSFITTTPPVNITLIKNNNGSFGDFLCDEKTLLKSSVHKIHSVKRLSDGEVFTIGDELKSGEKINSISLIEGKIRIYPRHSFYYLSDAIKIKKTPLFTTEDGVEVYTGDTIYHANLNYKKVYNSILNQTEKFTPIPGLYASEEKAVEYIINNKPCLSIVDLQKWFSEYGIQLTGLDRLKEIVKNKN